MTPDQRRDAVFYAILDEQARFGYPELDPMLVLAQSALETGNFTSNLIATQNNAFGMKMPQQRETMATHAGPSGFAVYASLQDSVIDYFMRQRYFGIPDGTASEYIEATMSEPYAYAEEGQAYIDAWREKYTGEDVAWTVDLDPVYVRPDADFTPPVPTSPPVVVVTDDEPNHTILLGIAVAFLIGFVANSNE